MSTNPITVSCRKAFTLIELLVVIAIIAILAAIFFPEFSQVREKARAATCLSNMKQIGLGMTQYEQDYDETVCPFSYANSSGSYYWFGFLPTSGTEYDVSQGFLQPYMKSVQIQDCPDGPPRIPNFNKPISYGVNAYYLYFPNYNGDPSDPNFENLSGNPIPATLAAFDSPANTVMLSDNALINPGTTTVVRYSLIRPPSLSTTYDADYGAYGETMHGRHQGMANILWCDGHAKALKVTNNPHASGLEKQNHLGDLINPAYPYGSANQDYYFQLKKP